MKSNNASEQDESGDRHNSDINDNCGNYAPERAPGLVTGKVLWFRNNKGYGFIKRDDNGKDIFVHYKNIVQQGYRTLEADQAVSFDVEASVTHPGSVHAVNCRVLP